MLNDFIHEAYFVGYKTKMLYLALYSRQISGALFTHQESHQSMRERERVAAAAYHIHIYVYQYIYV